MVLFMFEIFIDKLFTNFLINLIRFHNNFHVSSVGSPASNNNNIKFTIYVIRPIPHCSSDLYPPNSKSNFFS